MRLGGAFLIVAVLAPLPVQAMSVADFLAKAAVLKTKGMGALFAPELKQLRTEMEGVSTAYRADLARQKAAGQAPHSCPPPKGKAKIGPNELLGDFQAIPPAQRSTTSVKDAFYGTMKKRFPCR